MKITVIIPVYNVAEHLPFAMNSLLHQTFKDFKVILVDDGSTDQSGEICDQYAEEYDFVETYHKENGGLSEARNFGVSMTRTEYVTFLDSDDFLEPIALELLAESQKLFDVDCSVINIQRTPDYKSRGFSQMRENYLNSRNLFTPIEALKTMYLDKDATVSSCGKLFRKEYLVNNPYPVGKIYEDFYLIADLILSAKSVFISQLPLYGYYDRPGSTVNRTITENHLDLYAAYSQNKNRIANEPNGELNEVLDYKIIKATFKLVKDCVLTDSRNIYPLIRANLASVKPRVLTNRYLTVKDKIKYIGITVFPSFYWSYIERLKNGREK